MATYCRSTCSHCSQHGPVRLSLGAARRKLLGRQAYRHAAKRSVLPARCSSDNGQHRIEPLRAKPKIKEAVALDIAPEDVPEEIQRGREGGTGGAEAEEEAHAAAESSSIDTDIDTDAAPDERTMDCQTVAPPPSSSDILLEDLSSMSLQDLAENDRVYNKELSWLSFNWRVAMTGQQPTIPLFEQLRFLAISASNLDEFFAKRVGGLMRQRMAGVTDLSLTPSEQLNLISHQVKAIVQHVYNDLYSRVLPELASNGVRIVEYSQLSKEGVDALAEFFAQQIEVLLTPIKLDPGHPFPTLPSDSLNIAVLLQDPRRANGTPLSALVNIPCSLSRWHEVPAESAADGSSWDQGFVLLEEIIINNLSRLFGGMTIISAHTFRVTRNAELERHEEDADDLLDMISIELRERRFAPFVRLEVDPTMPHILARLICAELELNYEEEVYVMPGILAVADLMSMPVNTSKLSPSLLFPPGKTRPHPRLAPTLVQPIHRRKQGDWGGLRWKGIRSIFSVIREADLLVHHPYQSFSSSTQRLVEEAARDPHVVAIKATLYRTSSDSPIIAGLQKAAEAGKQVAVLVELKARFDEARNVGFARRLEDSGCTVSYGLVGLKTHCKTTLIVRREMGAPHGLRTYVHIGTGNYNPSTARIYTDFGLLTCRPDICADVVDLFKFLTGMHNQQAVGGYRQLLVANTNMRQGFAKLIKAEIEAAKAGKHAAITIKCNGLDDKAMVGLLHEAAAAGVRVDCIVRGVCSLRPGIPGLTENLRVVSIIGRYLEHHRVYCFHNQGSPQYYIGSADWMSRNLSKRVEVAVPILDEDLKEQLHEMLALCLFDAVNAWDMLPNGRYIKPAFRMRESMDAAPFTSGSALEDLWKMAEKIGSQAALLALTKAEVDRAVLTTKKKQGAV